MVHILNEPNTQLDMQQSDVLSASKNGLVATTYRDDYIVRGRSFANEITRTIDVSSLTNSTENFVLDVSACDCTQIFKMPILITPTNGFVIVNLYEDTNYVGTESLTFIDRNRLTANSTDISLKGGATGTVKGTKLLSVVFGTDETRQNAGGGTGTSANFLILNPNMNYLFEVIYSDDCTCGYNMEIVEV